jgi:hypothetical protein
MGGSSLLIAAVFFLGCAVGALLNSIYRTAMLHRIKESFERELRT